MALKYVLLGALSYQQPLTGYQLKQFIDHSAKHFWYAQTSQVYRTLETLEKEGLLTSKIEAQEKHPDRRIYQITAAGHADLLTWLKQPMTEIEPTKDALLVRLFFAAQLDKTTVLTQLRLQRALHEQQLQLFRGEIITQIQASAARRPDLKRDGLLWDAARRLGELSEETYIRWLDETIQRIEEEF
jgi:DNA-binding PadR family transcriptional regulator